MFEDHDPPALASRKTTRVSSLSPARSGEHETGLRFPRAVGEPHLLGELADRVVLAAVTGAEACGHDDARLHRVDELGRLDRSERVATADRDDQDIDVAEAVDLVLGELAAQASGRHHTHVIDCHAHDRGLAGGQPEDADAADLELARPADLLELTVAGAGSPDRWFPRCGR